MFLRQSSIWKQQCHTSAPYRRDEALKGAFSDSSCYHNQVSGMPVQFLAYLCLSSLSIKEQRVLLWAPASKQLLGKECKKESIHLSTDMPNRNSQRNMYLSSIPLCGLLLMLNLQLSSTYPISSGLTDNEMDILKVSLKKSDSETWLHHESLCKFQAICSSKTNSFI